MTFVEMQVKWSVTLKDRLGPEILTEEETNPHAPVKKRNVRNSKAPWLTPEIKRLMWARERTKRIVNFNRHQ